MEPEFEVEGSGVDPAHIEDELARRVADRRRSGLYTEEVDAMLADRLPAEGAERTLAPVEELDYSASRAAGTWEVTCAYPVATEKKALGPLIIFAKRLARLWARIAVGPIQRDQSTYNRHVAAALDALRRQALSERAAERAAEEDLCALAESMSVEGEGARLASACAAALDGDAGLTVLCPCPRDLLDALREAGFRVTPVLAGSSWEEAPPSARVAGPLSFLCRAAEGSLEALLVPGLAFWLRPERLVMLARTAYLAVAPGGRVFFAVHGFAAGPPAPAWCAPAVVERALAMAGFTGITVSRPAPVTRGSTPQEGYVVAARR